MRKVSCLLLILLGLTSGICFIELLLRLLGTDIGHLPAPYESTRMVFREPFTENSLTGWQLKPGNYQLSLGGRGRSTRVAIGPGNSRSTRNAGGLLFDGKSRILFIGDSYVFGEGLDDSETLPWKTQERHPDRNVINHAVGGYGTCQALLRLQQLQESLRNGDIVVYGLNEFHEERNTADPRLDYWVAIGSPSHKSGYPRCSLVNNRVTRKDPKAWTIALPFTGRSAVSRVLTDAWLSLEALPAMTQQRRLTDMLLENMRDVSGAHQASLVVILMDLSAEALTHYRTTLDELGIDYIDGSASARMPELKLPDGHPNSEATEIWAGQLGDYLSTSHGPQRH